MDCLTRNPTAWTQAGLADCGSHDGTLGGVAANSIHAEVTYIITLDLRVRSSSEKSFLEGSYGDDND